jgi:hypothetical protein
MIGQGTACFPWPVIAKHHAGRIGAATQFGAPQAVAHFRDLCPAAPGRGTHEMVRVFERDDAQRG